MNQPKRTPYDSRREITGCRRFTNLHREIGVYVSDTFHHAALDAECVEIHCETPAITTDSFGGYIHQQPFAAYA